MEFSGSTYLFNLAMIAITFAGFTAIFMMLRQARGGSLTKYDLFVTQNYMMVSFLIVFGALLPSLLAGFREIDTTLWQVASGSVAVLLVAFVFTFPYRRRRATRLPRPPVIWIQELVFLLATAILMINAFSLLRTADFPLYAVGMTLVLFGLFYSFLIALGVSVIDRHER